MKDAKAIVQATPPTPRDGDALAFGEAPVWRSVGSGWQPLFGSFKGVGYSIEWHDFSTSRPLDWAASFHPGCVELCLNLSGNAFVEGSGQKVDYAEGTAGFYRREQEPLRAIRDPGPRHRFLTVEFADSFLARNLRGTENKLHPIVRAAVEGKTGIDGPAPTIRLSSEQKLIVATLREPPVYAAAHPIWYQCKALELAVAFFFQPPQEEEMFCTRQQRLAQERVEQVIFLLKQNLVEPPSLEELGRKIGCSPFYLSRIFSKATGQTITQCLRELRMEKAAELLRSGEYNVTEAAMEVGYSSPSHFSQAFHETFGCCPGLYPLATPTQRGTAKTSAK